MIELESRMLRQNWSKNGHVTDFNGSEVISVSFENFRIPAAAASVFDDSL
jgi:hypothetical protein